MSVIELIHEPGCRPNEDPREPCDCNCTVIEHGLGSVVRPKGLGGRDVLEVAESVYRRNLERAVEPEVIEAIKAHGLVLSPACGFDNDDNIDRILDFRRLVQWKQAECRREAQCAAIGGAVLTMLGDGRLVADEGGRISVANGEVVP